LRAIAFRKRMPRLRILIYSIHFAPEPTGNGKYSGEMAAWLAHRGHSVRVVAAPPYYPSWKLHPEYRWPPFRRERWRGVDVWRAPLWVPAVPKGFNRLLLLLSFTLTSLPIMLRQTFWRPHIVMTVAPAFMCAPTGWLTARLCGAKAWLHLQDFEIDIAFTLRLLRSRLLHRAALLLERSILRRFDYVSSISRRMVERLIEKSVPAGRTRLFPNWVDLSDVSPSADGCAFRSRLGIAPDALVVLYSGSLGSKQGLMVIPQIASLLVDRPDIVFVICGDGVMKSALEQATKQMPRVRHLPLQPVERLAELLCMADIHLLTQDPSAADLVLPSKLSAMLASGRPVVATCREGTELEAVVSGCGRAVPPGDQHSLAAAIVSLADDPIIRQELGHRARAWAEANLGRDPILEGIFGPLADG
jgi:colanic acid biosynthesis glycosyl transferase WcaI